MSAERGWIGDPQPSVEWRDSHYSRTPAEADRGDQAEQEAKNAELHEIDHSHIPLLRIAEHTIGRRLTGELETTVMAGFVLPSILNG